MALFSRFSAAFRRTIWEYNRWPLRLINVNAKDLLRDLKIASPCHARWEDMEGSDCSRFCAQCQKNVYNFASMTAGETQAVLLQKEGRVCGRFYQRTDGTLLTEDCPIGLHRRVRRFATAAALLLFSATTALALGRSQLKQTNVQVSRARVYQTWDSLVWEVKGWFGIRRPILMGDVCLPLPKPPVSPNIPPNSTTSQ